MIITLVKAVAVMIILAVMILILVSVNHFISGDFNSGMADIDELRDNLDNANDVITDKNVFGELVRVRSKVPAKKIFDADKPHD